MNRRVLLFILAALLCNAPAFAQTCPSGASWCSGAYAYDAMGNIRAIGADTYVYDTAGRLVSGTAGVQQTPAIVSRQDYAYDAFGNRTAASRIAGSVNCPGGCELSPAIDPVTNHTTGSGAQYDAAGNLVFIQGPPDASYTYDAAGSLVHAVAGTDDRQFLYTVDDERIATVNGANGATWTWTIRGLDGKVLREFTSSQPPGGLPISNWQWTKDYVWRDGLLLASVTPTASGGTATQHFHLDHLGTPRLVTGDNGVQLSVHAYYPFGAELNLTPTEQPAELMKFTGHERDPLANDAHTLDYMHARYEMETMGRFLSIDPGEFWRLQNGIRQDRAISQRYLASPQVWNRYVYAYNNPISFLDTNGRQAGPASLAQLEMAELRMVREGKMTRAQYERRAGARATTGLVTGAILTGSGMIASAWDSLTTFLGFGGAAASAGGGTLLLGENMAERVEPLAEEINAATFNVPWTNMADMLARNMSWLQSQIDRGARIFDIGRDLTRDPSPFYNAEVNLLQANGYERVFLRLTLVQGEVQALYEWVKATH